LVVETIAEVGHKALAVNMSAGSCYRCNKTVLAGEGDYYESPLRLICAACSLKEGFVYNGIAERLAAQPVIQEDGEEFRLKAFQEADAKVIARYRAHLIGNAMGTGKTCVAAMAALRTDTGNLLFTPASVKRNWGREIKRWRPELDVRYADTQTCWAAQAPAVMRSKGQVLIGSYGVLPGTPCGGCRQLVRKLKALKKEKLPDGKRRYNGPIPSACTHRTPYEVHPKKFAATIDGKERVFDYHEGCEHGCHQANPVPEIPGPVLALTDECHAYKHATTLRTRNWRLLRESIWMAGGYIYGLSGTPCEGKPDEFWEVLVSLGLERASFGCWNNYYRIFNAWYTHKKGSSLRRPPEGELKEELHRRLKGVMVRRLRKDVLKDLPPVVEQIIDVELDERTLKAVNEAVHHMLAVRSAWKDVTDSSTPPSRRLDNPYKQGLSPDEKARRRGLYEQRVEELFQERPWNKDEELIAAVHEAISTMDSMPSIEELSRVRSMISQAKVAAVKEWMQSCQDQAEPTIVFSEHVQILKKLMNRPGWACFDGSLTATQRDVMVSEFQSGVIEHGLGVSIRAGGEGITLVRARVCGFIDLSWNPARNSQALARLLRMGAEGHDSIVAVYFRANHVVDRLVIETVKEKEAIMGAIDWSEAT